MDNLIDICTELSQNFIEFAYETNSQRAFPDARDGLKPGQRACLWEMYSKGYTSDKPHVKSAKIDGGVAASWWPHGTTAIYETFGRMSMPWVNNIPEVDFHGNNGNVVIGQALAADRYSEARLSKIVEEGMFYGIKKNNVPMILNFSEDMEWPEVLPAVFPRLLVNGSQGIGLTIANSWLPMNFKEVGEVILKYVNENVLDDNLELIDFCSGGTIINKSELPIIHKTGKGRVIVRGTTEIKGNSIFITELPYQVYVEPFIDSVKELIDSEEITAIKEIYNKTDKKRLLIEIQCLDNPDIVLKQLFSKTNLQMVYNANQMALVGKTPILLNLKEYIDIYINHNIECITKEYTYDYDKNLARQEIVQGLLKALENIDNIIELIKKSSSSAKAVEDLIKVYSLTENQAKAIVDMKLGRLANLEQIELQKEAKELKETVNQLRLILDSEEEKKKIFVERLNKLINKYGTPRRTKLDNIEITKEKKEKAEIVPEECVVVLTEAGNVKRIPSDSYRASARKAKVQDDITAATIRTNTVDSLIIFTNKGKLYRLPVIDIPIGINTARGVSVKTFFDMEIDEEPCLIYSIYKDREFKYIVFATRNGMIKKSELSEYTKTIKKTGLKAFNLPAGDEIAAITLVNDEEMIYVTEQGTLIRFSTSEINPVGRGATGVKAINLKDDDKVIAALPIRDSKDDLALFTKKGTGKRIRLIDIGAQRRGGKGMAGIRKGEIVSGATLLNDKDEILVCGNNNSLCIKGSDIPVTSRTALGNQVLKGNEIVSITKI